MKWLDSTGEEDTEDYMEHEHFEDITLPERDVPAPEFDSEEKLNVESTMEQQGIEDYNNENESDEEE